MEKILYCDSRGDKRFSALYAKIKLKNGTLETIEHLYQKVKRDEHNNPVGKGRFVHHFVLNGKTYPASYLSKYYRNLWKCYFKQNPDKLDEKPMTTLLKCPSCGGTNTLSEEKCPYCGTVLKIQ